MLEPAHELLQAARSLFACDYAQWVVEAQDTWDYRVVAASLPSGHQGYEVAHRTGIIGQVFRTETAIVAPDVRRHALYDSFDDIIDWEFAIPLFWGDQLAGVLNLEGRGHLALDEIAWRGLAGAVSATTRWRAPELMPLPGQERLMPTIWLTVRTGPAKSSCDAALDLGRWLAEAGKHVIVAGELTLAPSDVYPNVAEALARGLPFGGCVRGIGPRLDALPFGNLDHASELRGLDRLHPIVAGRYDYCIISNPTVVAEQ